MTFLIYLVGMVDSIRHTLVVLMILGGLPVLVLSSMVYIGTGLDDDACKEVYKYFPKPKSVVIALVCMLVARTFIPDSNTLAAMVIVPPVVEAVATNEEVHKLPNNVLKFLNNYLEEKTSGSDL